MLIKSVYEVLSKSRSNLGLFIPLVYYQKIHSILNPNPDSIFHFIPISNLNSEHFIPLVYNSIFHLIPELRFRTLHSITLLLHIPFNIKLKFKLKILYLFILLFHVPFQIQFPMQKILFHVLQINIKPD